MPPASSRLSQCGGVCGHVLAAAAVALPWLVAVVGCQPTAGNAGGGTTAAAPTSPAAVAKAGRYKVTAASASFYRLGPQQPGGPDLGLKQNTRLTLIRRGFGYSQVQLEDGTAGFVGTEDIVRLTPEEIAAEAVSPPGVVATAASNARGGNGNNNNNGGPKPLAAARRRPRPAGGSGSVPVIPVEEPNLPAAPEPTPRTGPVPTFRY